MPQKQRPQVASDEGNTLKTRMDPVGCQYPARWKPFQGVVDEEQRATPTTVRSKQVVEAARFPVEPDDEGPVEACAAAVWGPRQAPRWP
ncbi:hypothetical protein MTO96_034238 [Rhipicephalus appendiculatus]